MIQIPLQVIADLEAEIDRLTKQIEDPFTCKTKYQVSFATVC
jgi:hypothetical protein